MKIRIFLGVIGSGKSYCSNQLVQQGYQKISVADSLRDALWGILGWKPRTDEEYNAFKQHELIDVTNSINTTIVTGRQVLQNMGEVFKSWFGRDYWATQWYSRVLYQMLVCPIKNGHNVVCDDVRFPEEVEQALELAENGYDVQFIFCDYKSERYNSTNQHISERYAQAILALNKYKDGDIIAIEDLLKINEQFYIYD